MEAIVQVRANLNAFLFEPSIRAIKSASGGIGKNEASANDKTNRAAGP